MGTEAVGKGEICKPKRIRVILLGAFSKSVPEPPSALASAVRLREGRAEYTPHPEKKPTTVDEHFVNGALSLSLFSRLPLHAGADDGFQMSQASNFFSIKI